MCNVADDDCDGVVEEGVASDSPWYADVDGDGFGGGVAIVACSAPAGYVAASGDCEDDDSTRHPEATEVCNLVDDDCDETVDDDAVDGDVWYFDGDADGFGDAQRSTVACLAPDRYTSLDSDCDDADDSTHPGAEETCDEADQDCDGAIDEDASDGTITFVDADGDGFGAPSTGTIRCGLDAGRSENGNDCDDTDAAVNPDAQEVWYDGTDQDCDRRDDDIDGDGFLAATDCADGDSTVNPAAAEVAGDGIDQNCDGVDGVTGEQVDTDRRGCTTTSGFGEAATLAALLLARRRRTR